MEDRAVVPVELEWAYRGPEPVEHEICRYLNDNQIPYRYRWPLVLPRGRMPPRGPALPVVVWPTFLLENIAAVIECEPQAARPSDHDYRRARQEAYAAGGYSALWVLPDWDDEAAKDMMIIGARQVPGRVAGVLGILGRGRV